jgi:signal transduction histidine kinase
MNRETLELVRQLPLFATLEENQFGCFEAGEVVSFEPDTILVREGDPAEFFGITLEGEIQVIRAYDNQDIVMGVSKPGMFMGEIPLLLDIPAISTARASKPSRMFRLGKDDFWKMMATCPTVARQILRTAATRLRNIEGFSQQREKLESLGTMAAGLAHELNNPASAARRAAAHLQETVNQVQGFVCRLSRGLTPGEWQHLIAAAEDALARQSAAPHLNALDRSDREETLSGWFDRSAIADGWKLAPTFVNAGIDETWLEELLAKLPPPIQPDAFGWLEARLSLKLLLNQVEQSSGRVEELVKAVKAYSFMGQSPRQETDVHDGIESTLTMLGHKLKGVTLTRCFDRTIPRFPSYGSELNQVWTNLIDNAIHAVGGKGSIDIRTMSASGQVIVEITDDGPGIPKEFQGRIFEPFFTTKSVGTGTGLGLIISHRIVADRHGGEIEFESKPGETRFRVRLPLNNSRAGSKPGTPSGSEAPS